MTPKSTPTPTPWAVDTKKATIYALATFDGGEHIARLDASHRNSSERLADAAYIVKCVNAHKALLDVLKEAKNLIDNYSDSMESFDSGNLEKAIAKAEGGK